MLNKAVLIGRLSNDPDLRFTPTGKATCSFSLACERPFKTNGKKEVDFIPVVTWNQIAETCANYLKKGRLVAVEGRIQVRNYDRDGRKVYVTEVIADNVRFLENNRDEDGKDYTYNKQSDPFKDDGQPIDISTDDFPF